MNKKNQEDFEDKERNYGKVCKVAGPCKIYYFYPSIINISDFRRKFTRSQN